MRTQHDKDIEFVLWYAYKNRYGFFDDLDKLNKPILLPNCVWLALSKQALRVMAKHTR